MASVVFLDEAGDLSLENIDKSFPLFTLMLFVADKEEYVSNIVPAVVRLKLNFWQHEGVVLHSRDIRRAHGDFI